MDCLCNGSAILHQAVTAALTYHTHFGVPATHVDMFKVCRALLTVIVKSLQYRDVIKMNHTVT